MSYLAILGFAMMALLTYLLMKDKFNILVCFAIVPLTFSFLSGASIAETTEHVTNGLGMTRDLFLMIMFSLPFFALMSDAGLFDIIVHKLMQRMNINGPLLCSLTLIIAAVATLDGSVMSTFLIIIPLLMPLYKKLKIDTVILVFLVSVGIMFGTVKPWNARVLRSAALVTTDIDQPAMYIFLRLLPIMLMTLVITMVYAYFLGKRNQIKNGYVMSDHAASVLGDDQLKLSELSRPKLFWFNVLLVIAVVTLLIITDFPEFYIFAVGLIIALVTNYGGDRKLQDKLISKYATVTYPIAPIIFMSGIIVGVLQGTGMMDEMVYSLLQLVPSVLGSFLHLIVAVFSAPLMFIFTNDTWYFALTPIVSALSEQFNVSQMTVILALYFNLGAFASIVAQPQIVMACETAGVNIKQYIKFSFFKLWGITIVWTVIGMIMGLFI